MLRILGEVSGADAQSAYAFTSSGAGDGFTWDVSNGVPNDLPDSFGFETPDDVEFANGTVGDAARDAIENEHRSADCHAGMNGECPNPRHVSEDVFQHRGHRQILCRQVAHHAQ